MPWAAAGAVVGGAISAYGASDAASTQADASKAATQAQQQMYNQNVQRLQPWTDAGSSALNSLTGMLGGGNGPLTQQFNAQTYQQSPGYQWQLGQGTQAIMNNASALGGVNSGNTLKALTSYGQGLANQDYYQAANQYSNWQNQVYNMLSGVSNTGANAAGQVAGIGANTANQIGSNILGAGNAQAAGTVGMTNALGSTVGNLGNLAMMYQMQGGGGNSYMPAIPDSGQYAPPIFSMA